MPYPHVVSEEATIALVVTGHSIARYGDGELKIMQGRRCVSQIVVPGISEELRELIACLKTAALVGIPTLDKRSPKFEVWSKIAPKFIPYLSKRAYYSAFITRPDSAPWLGTKDYFDLLETLWKDQRITFVGNGVRSLTAKFLMATGAKSVDWVECSYAHSYVDIDKLMKEVLAKKNHRVLLCVGPTATCMAERLAQKGHHAIDLGHVGMYFRRYEIYDKWKAGQPVWQEQREINRESGLVEPNPPFPKKD